MHAALQPMQRATHREHRARVAIHRHLAGQLGAAENTPCDHDVTRTGKAWPHTVRYTAVMYCPHSHSYATATGVGPTSLNATLAALARLSAEVSQ